MFSQIPTLSQLIPHVNASLFTLASMRALHLFLFLKSYSMSSNRDLPMQLFLSIGQWAIPPFLIQFKLFFPWRVFNKLQCDAIFVTAFRRHVYNSDHSELEVKGPIAWSTHVEVKTFAVSIVVIIIDNAPSHTTAPSRQPE